MVNHLSTHQLQSGHFWDKVVPPLPLLLLQLDGDAADGGALQPLHQVSDEPGNLRTQQTDLNYGCFSRLGIQIWPNPADSFISVSPLIFYCQYFLI